MRTVKAAFAAVCFIFLAALKPGDVITVPFACDDEEAILEIAATGKEDAVLRAIHNGTCKIYFPEGLTVLLIERYWRNVKDRSSVWATTPGPPVLLWIWTDDDVLEQSASADQSADTPGHQLDPDSGGT